jgi:hypothetical protein
MPQWEHEKEIMATSGKVRAGGVGAFGQFPNYRTRRRRSKKAETWSSPSLVDAEAVQHG